MIRLAAALLLSVRALACDGPTPHSRQPTLPAPNDPAPAAPAAPAARAPAPAPAPPAPPSVALAIGTLQFTVTAAPGRELPAIVWYPARSAGPSAPPIVGRKLPVVLISHGLNGRKEHAPFLVERLVGAGYLVAAVDHVNDGAAIALQRPVDVTKLLDRIAQRGAEPAWLADVADLEHVGVYGHSFGGYTALALAGAKIGPNPEWTARCAATPAALDCPAPQPGKMKTTSLRDPRIDFVVAATPAGFFQFGRAGTAAIETPVLLLGAGKDQLTPPATFVRPLLLHMKKQTRWYVEITLAGHMTFVDLCAKVAKLPSPFKEEVAAQCAPDAPLPLRIAHELIGDLVVAAFDHKLKGAPVPNFHDRVRAKGAGHAEAAY